ncbi:hypothetical protein F5B21DRAFT_85448 [Xylaria acuta]|nr:hypothetical protein F5B21DRAFT_85448 [Xylaria acuta]
MRGTNPLLAVLRVTSSTTWLRAFLEVSGSPTATAVETYLQICGSNDAYFVALTYTDLTPTLTLPPPSPSPSHHVHPGAAPAFPLWPTGQSDERYWMVGR